MFFLSSVNCVAMKGQNEGSVGYWTTRGCLSDGFPLCENMGVFDHAKFTVPL